MSISVEVIYAQKERQEIVRLQLAQGATVADAINQSAIFDKIGELHDQPLKVGVFGKLVQQTTILRDHDRVELYRPLIADPKQVRKKRAAKA